ncbi:ABC transporter substrate-binding protein [Alphaproteobacteria bacterium]|nr:ABC transporter substrate-binding protein [Alphaproteobacteria bacterium]MDA8642777.1 ABC transporter substrate-binding protein [Alphaproteobacteria bacterium]MDA8667123.1 ABC transporter substrate-binding protein [Alphaproteobacteria bacterium]MDA9591139.1 ABC transporter substrate-binding protein [Alphaproteobacteria bacterium]MDB2381327.1 ABC transporter substrate-binding protein [Alphaproteobacteria bacterium]
MRAIITAFALWAFMLTPGGAQEADLAKAQAFVMALADDAIEILSTEKTRAGREGKFAALLNERANIRRIARFTLGQFGRKISKEDFASFEKLLGQFIVKVYANRLGEYSDEKVIVGKAQAKKKNVIVESRIEFANGRDPIDIDWWLRLEKDGSMTLFDVRVLGVWMAQEQRDAFSSVLKNNKGDINALLDHLRKQIKADAAEK